MSKENVWRPNFFLYFFGINQLMLFFIHEFFWHGIIFTLIGIFCWVSAQIFFDDIVEEIDGRGDFENFQEFKDKVYHEYKDFYIQPDYESDPSFDEVQAVQSDFEQPQGNEEDHG